MSRPPLVVLLGPTASGKTEMSIQWARELGFEIVSADSVQVYRHMDVGTAKPSKEIRLEIPHHMVDVADPDESYSAMRYQREADEAIAHIARRERPVLVVAGTGLYLRALVKGLFEGVDSDPGLRRSLQERARNEGVGALYQMLREVDPEASQRIHPHDLFRIVRALEVYLISGRPISSHHKDHRLGRDRYKALFLGIHRERADLFSRIDKRVDAMMEQGLLDEVRSLLKRGYHPELPAMKAIGYRHMLLHLEGKISLDHAVMIMKRDTKRFARRQLTWFKAMARVHWFRPQEAKDALNLVMRFLQEETDLCLAP